jgi:cytochrome b561
MIKNSVDHYGSVAKLFHWIMAILMILLFVIGYVMTNIPKSMLRHSLYDFHKATGLVVFSLFFLRLTWRFINIQPKLPTLVPTLVKWMAKSNSIILYLLMMTMPISGFLISTLGGHEVTFYYLFTINPLSSNQAASHLFSNIHLLLGYVLIVAFLLHVIGVLYHHFIVKDNVLRRMLIHSHDRGLL